MNYPSAHAVPTVRQLHQVGFAAIGIGIVVVIFGGAQLQPPNDSFRTIFRESYLATGAFVFALGLIVTGLLLALFNGIQQRIIRNWDIVTRSIDWLQRQQGRPLIITILLFATLLRFYHIDDRKLWNDELTTAWIAMQPTFKTALAEIPRPWLPMPGYFNHAWVALAGSSELALRLIPALCSILAIAVLYTLGKKLLDWQTGVIAALLMAVAHQLIVFGQEARVFSAMILWVSVGVFLWLRIIDHLVARRPLPPLLVIGYMLALGTSIHVQQYSLIIVGLQLAANVLLLLLGRCSLKQMLIPCAAILLPLLTMLPWLDYFFYNPPGYATWFPDVHRNPIVAIVNVLIYYVNDSYWFVGAAALLSLMAAGFWFLTGRPPAEGVRQKQPFHPLLILNLWLFLPIIALYVISISYKTVIYGRYMLILAPAFYLLVGLAIARLPLHAVLKLAATLGITLVLLVNLVFYKRQYAEGSHAYNEEVFAYVIEQYDSTPEAAIILETYGDRSNVPMFSYTFRQLDSELRVDELLTNMTRLDGVLADLEPHYIWLIRIEKQLDPAYLTHLEETYDLVQHQYFTGHTEVWLYSAR